MRRAVGAVSCATAVWLAAPGARACGGSFNLPSAAGSVVTGHRMAFASGGGRTVLWDQIQYTGTPEDFAWVIPIEPGAHVEVSSDAWFEVLDALSAVHVAAPTIQCAVPETGGSCGFSTADGSATFPSETVDGFGVGVRLLHEGSVGPYETATLSAANGDSLRAWLDKNGYVVPADLGPVIDDYVAEGRDFIALRLKPGLGVNAMRPVRVVTPGGASILPLRMALAGTGTDVNVVLFVVGDGRYGVEGFEEGFIDISRLTFDVSANTTNYTAVRGDALRRNGGRAFLTAFAQFGLFGANSTVTYASSNGYSVVNTFTQAYFQQAAEDDQRVLAESCGNVDVALSANLPVGDGTGNTVNSTALDCSGYSDISAALTGLVPAAAWITRLELNLPRDVLTTDRRLVLAAGQAPAANAYTAPRVVNRGSVCPEPVFESSMIPRAGSSAAAFFWGMAALAGLFGFRRARNVRR